MKKLILFVVMLFVIGNVNATGYKECEQWDTFCKNPAQIVATKCRLGVPVKHEQCTMLGQRTRYVYDQGSLVEGLPVTSMETGKPTEELLTDFFSTL